MSPGKTTFDPQTFPVLLKPIEALRSVGQNRLTTSITTVSIPVIIIFPAVFITPVLKNEISVCPDHPSIWVIYKFVHSKPTFLRMKLQSYALSNTKALVDLLSCKRRTPNFTSTWPNIWVKGILWNNHVPI